MSLLTGSASSLPGVCGCCGALRPRYKRLVDNIFPEDPEVSEALVFAAVGLRGCGVTCPKQLLGGWGVLWLHKTAWGGVCPSLKERKNSF